MTASKELKTRIRAMIEANGPMPVSHYMSLCLDHYYGSRDPFGAGGDFITAPEVSQMFGELIGLWCAGVWQMMDRPQRIALVELGPGRGTLMADALRAVRIVPEFGRAIELHLVETSPAMRRRQQAALADTGQVHWHGSVDGLPDAPLVAIANEFVDALPIDQFVRAADGWHMRRVGLGKDGGLRFGADPFARTDLRIDAPVGAMLELRHDAPIGKLAARIVERGGAALIIDYGPVAAGFGDTLQAVRGHAHADPLADPGEADLTAQVDFVALGATARAAGACVHGPLTQGEFLRRLGIEARAARLKRDANADTRFAIDAALERLAGPEPGMGELFKVLAVSHPALETLPGFIRAAVELSA